MSETGDSLDIIGKLIRHPDPVEQSEITYREEDWLKLKQRLDKIESKCSPTEIPLLGKLEIVFINRRPYLKF